MVLTSGSVAIRETIAATQAIMEGTTTSAVDMELVVIRQEAPTAAAPFHAADHTAVEGSQAVLPTAVVRFHAADPMAEAASLFTSDASPMALTFELCEPTALASRGWQFHIRLDQKNPKLALSAHGSQSECNWALASGYI